MSKNDNETVKTTSKTSSTKKNNTNNKTTKNTKSKTTSKTTNKTKSNTTSKSKTTSVKKSISKDSNKSSEKTSKKNNNIVKKDENAVVKKRTKKEAVKDDPIVVKEVKLEKVIGIEKDESIQENNKFNGAKIENAKYTIKKVNKTAIGIGIFISLLGIIALIIALIANRIVDREFISDSQVIIMVIVSIIIELMGAAIIIKET